MSEASNRTVAALLRDVAMALRIGGRPLPGRLVRHRRQRRRPRHRSRA
ncbi:MAG: hypothetical protein U0531_08265 [Dehalococcoidia bacterium]